MAQVYSHTRVPLLLCDLQRRLAHIVGSVIDQSMNAGKLIKDFGCHWFYSSINISDVALVIDRRMMSSGKLLHQFRGRCLLYVEYDYLCALECEGFNHRRANACCSSGNNHNAISKARIGCESS